MRNKYPATDFLHTGYVKDGLEAEPETSNFHRIFLFDAVIEKKDSFPVFRCKHCIVVRIQSRSLRQSVTACSLYLFPVRVRVRVRVGNAVSNVYKQ